MENTTIIQERLAALRRRMQDERFDAFIVPSNDPHFSEYVAPHWGCRAWISGFDGSAGTVVVTRDRAALWTDSRYFLQAAEQLAGTGIELQRAGLPQTPSIPEWLNAARAVRVGTDGRLFSRTAFDSLRNDLSPYGIEPIPADDPFAAIWTDRPALPQAPASLLDTTYSGETAKNKLDRIRAAQPDGYRPPERVGHAPLDDTRNRRGDDPSGNDSPQSDLGFQSGQELR